MTGEILERERRESMRLSAEDFRLYAVTDRTWLKGLTTHECASEAIFAADDMRSEETCRA